MDLLNNVNIDKINAAIREAIQTKKEISSLKKEALQMSKDAIELAESGKSAAAEAVLYASARKINRIKSYLRTSVISLHFQSDLLYSVEKEYCEAVIVCYVMTNREIPGYEELSVDPLVFIHSFVEAVSELGKINEKLENRNRITANKLAMQDITVRLEELKHFAGSVTGDIDNQLDKLRHKIYTGKTDVDITPEDALLLATEPEEIPEPEIIEPDTEANRAVMTEMSRIISGVKTQSDSDLRDFKKTWTKVSENLRTGLIETNNGKKSPQSDSARSEFETEGQTLKSYKGKSQTVEIPKGIRVIDANAFSGCKEVQTIKIPDSVEEIRPYAFTNCKNLSAFVVNSRNRHFSQAMGVLYNKDKTALICYPSNDKTKHKKRLPDTLTAICEGAFAYCKNLEVLNLTDTITDIHKFAFTHCYNLTIQAPEGSMGWKYAKDHNLLKSDGANRRQQQQSAPQEKPAKPAEPQNDLGYYFREIDSQPAAGGQSEPDETAGTAPGEEPAADVAAETPAADLQASDYEASEAQSEPTEEEPVEEPIEEQPAETAEEPSEAAAETAGETVAEESAEDEPAEAAEKPAGEPAAEEQTAEAAEEPSEAAEETDGTEAEAPGDRKEAKAGKSQDQGVFNIRGNTKNVHQKTFKGQKAISIVSISANVRVVDPEAFDQLTGLKAINVRQSCRQFCSVDGVLYSKDKTILVRYPQEKSNLKYSIDPQTVKIASHAFYGCDRLKTIHLPDTDVTIAPDAFEENTPIKLKNAKIGSQVHSFAKEKGLL